MITARNIILSGQFGPTTDVPATGVFYTPEIRADAAEEVVYRFVVESLEGTPTNAWVTVAFQICQRTSGGGLGDIGKHTDAVPIWQTVDANTHRGLLPDGDWPTRVAYEASVLPIVLSRRIRGGCSNRLAIAPGYIGGTTPAFRMTAECEVRY